MNLANTQQAQQEAGVDLPGGDKDDSLAPVDVVIDGEAPAPAPPAPRQQGDEPAPRAPLPRPQARIQTLTHERDSIAGERDRLLRELETARAEAAANKAEAQASERMGMENMVARTKAEVTAAKAALLKAKDESDTTAEVEAQARLSRAVAEEADADAWVTANPKQEPQQRQPEPRQQPQQRQQEQPPLAEPVRDFMSENPWFSSVEMGADGRPVVDSRTGRFISNPDFDPEMHNTAMLEDQKIQREMRIGQLPKDYIGSPEYFARVKTRVETEYPDAFEDGGQAEPAPQQRPRAPQMGAGKQSVAPSSRQIPGQQPQRQGTKMRLDGEEASLVRSLVDNGTMIYPRNHSDVGKRGQKMSYDDAYVKYATEKKADQASRS